MIPRMEHFQNKEKVSKIELGRYTILQAESAITFGDFKLVIFNNHQLCQPLQQQQNK